MKALGQSRDHDYHGEPDFTHQAEMGFTHRELLKGLPAAVAPFAIEKRAEGEYELRHRDDHRDRRVRLTLAAETTRRLKAFRVPLSAVKLEFFGFNQAGFDEFMQRYKRYLHKGGG